MAINNKTLSSIQGKVTGLTTNETDFREGIDDTLVQVNATEVLLQDVDSADMTKLSEVTATSAELNKLAGVTASTQEINKLTGLNATTSELNILNGVTATFTDINKLAGLTTTKAELGKLAGFTGTHTDLNKIAAVTASATDLNALDGFVDTHSGTLADLVRCIQLDNAGDGTNGQVLTATYDEEENFQYSWTTPSSFTFTLEDEDGTEVSIDTDEVKIVGDGMNIDWGTGDGTDSNPYQLQIDNADKGSSQNIFKNILVSGQDDIVAGSNDDSLTLVADTGITITTNSTTDTVTFGHSDTSTQDSVSNSGRTYIQDITLDGFGHITGITSATETVVNTDTTYSAGAGLDLTGTTFSVEPDLRDGITHIGYDAGDYIEFSDTNYVRVVVNGSERARFESDGDFHADGDVIAYSSTISDERLKKDIQKVENGLDKVCKLSGYTFKYIDNDRQSAGVIAQEVEKVLPEAVVEKKLPFGGLDQDKEYKVVNYASLHSLMIEAIKELKAEIEDIKLKIS
jgi:hypothetical protein